MGGLARAQVPESAATISTKIESGNSETVRRWVQLSCVGSYQAKSKAVVLDEQGKKLVLIVTSSGCDEFAVILFKRSGDFEDAWSYEQTIRLQSRYETTPTVRYPEFAQSGIHEIFISGVVTDSGSGVTQRDCVVLKLIDGHLTMVFNESEFVSLSTKNLEVLQKSNFGIRDSSPANMSGNQFLREDQSVTVNGKRIERVRNCFWDDFLRHFTCVEGVPGSSAHMPDKSSAPGAHRVVRH